MFPFRFHVELLWRRGKAANCQLTDGTKDLLELNLQDCCFKMPVQSECASLFTYCKVSKAIDQTDRQPEYVT